MSKVFISHSTADREFVEREIIAPLRQAGIETWYSKEDLRPKSLWASEIVIALKDCDWFLLVMSPQAEKSEWVRDELHWAMDHRLGRIVPVLIEACDPYEFHIRLQRLQFIDFRQERAQARSTLIRTFPGVAPPPKTATPPPIAPPPKPITPPQARPAPPPIAPQPERRVPSDRRGTASAPSTKPVAPPPMPPGRPPIDRKVALAGSFGGLLLLGIIIYVTTDKGRVKIDLGEPKGPVNVVVKQDDKKVADITVEPPPAPAVASRPVEPPSLPAPPPPAPAAKPQLPTAPAKEWVSPFSKMKFVLIPAGSFEMGSPDDAKDASDDEKPRHRVTISRPFYLGVLEVTQGEYQQVMSDNPSHFKGLDTLPVEEVSWLDAVKFCNGLSEKDGRRPYYKAERRGLRPRRIEDTSVTILGGNGYRLPTEAEWEYACRAPVSGAKVTKHPFGDDNADLASYAWYGEGVSGKTHPVGQKKANRWGLYDMQGNVWEWCQDWYSADYYGSSPATDPPGPATASGRVSRGGGLDLVPRGCRPAYRGRFTPDARIIVLGFRLAADQQ